MRKLLIGIAWITQVLYLGANIRLILYAELDTSTRIIGIGLIVGIIATLVVLPSIWRKDNDQTREHGNY